MKKLLTLFLVLLVASTAFAGQQLVNLPLTADLTDLKGNLTAGGLIRNSDATYVNTAGALAYSRGTRTNYLLQSENTSDGVWVGGTVQTVTVALGTYSLAVYKTGATLTVAATTAAYTLAAGAVASVGTPIYFTVTTAGNITITTDSANPKGSLEKLPSGNVIGSDLMDQESLTARAAGYTLVVGAVYKIGTRATLDFTTVGAANNTAGTYFICHTAGDLGAGDVASTVDSPAKGSFHGTAMLAGSTELVTNGGFETAGAGAPDLFGTWTETTGGTDTIADSTGAGTFYLGAHAALLTYVDNGATYVANTITTTAGKLYKLEFYTMATAEDKAGRYSVYDLTGSADIVAATTTGVTANTYTKVTKYFVTPASCVSVSIRMWTPTEAGGAYYDYVSVRQVQTTWTRAGTNTLEIDEAVGTGGALKITWIDDATGASLNLANASDQSADLVVGETYQVTFNSKVTAGSVTVAVQKSDATVLASVAEAVTASMTAHTLYFKATATATDKLTFSGMAATEAIWIDDLTIKSVPDIAYLSPGTYTATAGSTATIPAEPRFETNGLLVEGEGTNLLEYSTPTQVAGWSGANGTSVADATVLGIDGTSASAKFTEATDTNQIHSVILAIQSTAPDSASMSGSIFAKAGTRTWIQVLMRDKAGSYDAAYFNLEGEGTVGTVSGGYSAWIKRCANGWYRCMMNSATATGTNALNISVRVALNGSTIQYNGTGGTVYLDRAQIELTAYPTSAIPTNGCPVTRLTEAGSATNGYSWTKAAAIDTALGVKGTVLLDFIPGHAAAGGTGTGSGILAFAAAAANVIYYDYTNTNFESADGTNTPENDESIANGTTYTLAVRFDETADGGAGYLKVSEKHGGTWTHGTATAFDGAFVVTGTKAYIGYGNEYPFWIKNVKFFDGWVKDAYLDRPVGGGLFPPIPVFDTVRAYQY